MVQGQLPLYRQSFGFTCGPAALMMVMKGLEPDLELDRYLELDIWREAALMESRGTSSFGLALAARRRNFRVTVRTISENIGFTSRLVEHFPGIDVEFMEMLFEHTRDQALKEGVVWDRRYVEMGDLRESLAKGTFPVVLVSTEMMGEEEPIPHWVVVTGMDDGTVRINNPETGREEEYTTDLFERFLGFSGCRCLISVGK